MKPSDIEYWAVNVIDRVVKGQPVEDSRVELKGDWTDFTRAARRIAGHANSAHGEPILWLIGVDEKEGVKGVDYSDVASWFSQVKSCFDGISPESTGLAISYKGVTVYAILFETDRAPYVVKNASGGPIQLDVPWRDGTSTRSANRSELIRILVPLRRLPTVEVLNGNLVCNYNQKDNCWHWHATLYLYVASMPEVTLVIPFHKCSATFGVDQLIAPTSLTRIWLGPPSRNAPSQRSQPDSLTIDGTSSELIIQGPGKFRFVAGANTQSPGGDITGSVASIRVNLHPVDFELAIHTETDLSWVSKDSSPRPNENGRWEVS